MQLRYIKWNQSTGQILDSSPTYLFGVTADRHHGFLNYVELLKEYMRTISNSEPGSEVEIIVNRHVGGIKKRDLHAPPQTNSVPDPGSIGH